MLGPETNKVFRMFVNNYQKIVKKKKIIHIHTHTVISTVMLKKQLFPFGDEKTLKVFINKYNSNLIQLVYV